MYPFIELSLFILVGNTKSLLLSRFSDHQSYAILLISIIYSIDSLLT
jgi:hypothetical protein